MIHFILIAIILFLAYKILQTLYTRLFNTVNIQEYETPNLKHSALTSLKLQFIFNYKSDVTVCRDDKYSITTWDMDVVGKKLRSQYFTGKVSGLKSVIFFINNKVYCGVYDD